MKKQLITFIIFTLLSLNIYANGLNGTVAWYNYSSGYGAINPDNKSPQLSFSYSNITGKDKALSTGTRVTYTINKDRNVVSVTKLK